MDLIFSFVSISLALLQFLGLFFLVLSQYFHMNWKQFSIRWGILILLLIPFVGVSQTAIDSLIKTDTSSQQIQPKQDTSIGSVLNNLETYAEVLNKANNILKRGFDTSAIAESLPENEQLVIYIQKNLGNSKYYNLRSLYTNRVVLVQLKKQMRDWQEQLLRYSHQLDIISNDIAKISQETIFSKLSQDSGLLSIYVLQIQNVSKKWEQADTSSKFALNKIGYLESRVVALSFQINDLLDEVQFQIKNYSKNALKLEESYLFNAHTSDYKTNFWQVYQDTFKRIAYLIPFYLNVTSNDMVWHLVWIILVFVWLWWCIRRLHKLNKPEIFSPIPYLSQGVLFTVCFFIFLISPFVYDTPPMSLVQMLSFLLMLIFTKLAWFTWSKEFKVSWFYFLLLFLGISFDVVLIEPSLLQRWFLIFLNLSSVILAFRMQKRLKGNVGRYENYYFWLLNLYVFLHILAIISNISGRVTLSKLFSSSAIISISFALAIDVLESLVFEIIYLHLEAFKESKISLMFNFEEIKKNFQSTLRIILVFIWVMIFFFSLNLYDFISEKMGEWLAYPIKLGNLNFTAGTILLFFFILWISSNISKLLTFFFGTSGQFAANKKNKNGSWVLLMRLGVFSLGFFVAVAAAGIPFDRITIVIGALGVGIGFGLQNIVNNLVSGIILAFEKPMQIGDVIEIDKQTGTVKEIGIRSSKITTYDGADIVVPNGEFISKQLINWTLTNSYRRIELIVGVAYDSELSKVQELISGVIHHHKEVMRFPQPMVLVHEFSDNSVNFRVLFWTSDFDTWTSLKSSILMELFDVFRKNNITIPFPQRDLHIKSVKGLHELDKQQLLNDGEDLPLENEDAPK
jgi:potassium-dependent mechanosensitive channel